MLEKVLKNLCDSHFHLVNLPDLEQKFENQDFFYKGCSTALSIEEWNRQVSLALPSCVNINHAFGLHPQSAGFINIEENINFLENLLKAEKSNAGAPKVAAIGEVGFDFFTPEFKAHKNTQELMFNVQLELALKYNKPVVIHCRKANEKLFEYAPQLKKLPSVLFHSFMGTPAEAESLIKKGINAYFSFGKQILNNNKKVIQCVKQLPVNHLLPETDAPYQNLKGEEYTCPKEIATVYKGMAELRNTAQEELEDVFLTNYERMFCI